MPVDVREYHHVIYLSAGSAIKLRGKNSHTSCELAAVVGSVFNGVPVELSITNSVLI